MSTAAAAAIIRRWPGLARPQLAVNPWPREPITPSVAHGRKKLTMTRTDPPIVSQSVSRRDPTASVSAAGGAVTPRAIELEAPFPSKAGTGGMVRVAPGQAAAGCGRGVTGATYVADGAR